MEDKAGRRRRMPGRAGGRRRIPRGSGRRMRMPRDIARKPVPKTETYLKFGYVATERECHLCPECGRVLDAGPGYQPHYCGQCGQRVDFDGIEWKAERELGYAGRRDGHEPVKD